MTASELPRIFCAADTVDTARAASIADAMSKAGCGLKIGLEFFNAHGLAGVAALMRGREDLPLFLDLKFHDIPNTVAGAVRAVGSLRPAYINVHASGGAEMMRAARAAALETAAAQGSKPPRLLAVTLLTSLDDAALDEIGYRPGLADRVLQLAALAQQAGMDGVVCSAHEIAALRKACGRDFALMVPGIRPAGADKGDQKRVMTPAEAVSAGATHLVIGRPITGAPDAAQAARDILKSIAS